MEITISKIYQTVSDTALQLVSVLFTPYSTLWWVYLLSAFGIAAGVYLLRDAGVGERSPLAVLRACLPKSIYATRSFRHDVAMCAVNILLHSLFLGSMILSTVWVEQQTWKGLHDLFGEVEHRWSGWGATALMTFVVMLAVDLGFFVSHYLQHKIPWLWQFHKIHHSAEALNPFTTFRRHPIDLMIDGNITGLLVGVALGVFDYLSFGGLEMTTIAGVNAGIFLFLITTAHLQHSHFWLSYGALNRFIVSPAMHHIHHSRDSRHLDKNFGNMFSFWDALIGTCYLPQTRETLCYGLAHDDGKSYERFWQFYLKPFVETGRMFTMKKKMSVTALVGCSATVLLFAANAGLAADAGAEKKMAPKQGARAVVAPMYTPKPDGKGAKGVVAPMFTPGEKGVVAPIDKPQAKGARGAVAPMFTPKGQGARGAVAPMFTPGKAGAKGAVAPMFTPGKEGTKGVVAPMFTPKSAERAKGAP